MSVSGLHGSHEALTSGRCLLIHGRGAFCRRSYSLGDIRQSIKSCAEAVSGSLLPQY
jgi:hypothetical protein